MFTTMFWVKYIFRVLHIGSIITICQAIITAKLTGEIVQGHSILYMLAGITAIVSGLVNTFILKPKEMGERRKLWISYNHLKALSSIVIFTPLIKALPFSQEQIIDIKFYWMVIALLGSPFARFYRQFFVAKQKERKEEKSKEEHSD